MPKKLFLLAICVPWMAQAAPSTGGMSPVAFSKKVYESAQSLPPQNGFSQVVFGGGNTELSSWQYFVIEAQDISAVEVAKSYLDLVEKNLIAAGLTTSGVPRVPGPSGLMAMMVKTGDGKVQGTISVVVRPLTKMQFTIVVAMATSP